MIVFFPVRTNSEKKEHLGDEFAEVLLSYFRPVAGSMRKMSVFSFKKISVFFINDTSVIKQGLLWICWIFHLKY